MQGQRGDLAFSLVTHVMSGSCRGGRMSQSGEPGPAPGGASSACRAHVPARPGPILSGGEGKVCAAGVSLVLRDGVVAGVALGSGLWGGAHVCGRARRTGPARRLGRSRLPAMGGGRCRLTALVDAGCTSGCAVAAGSLVRGERQELP